MEDVTKSVSDKKFTDTKNQLQQVINELLETRHTTPDFEQMQIYIDQLNLKPAYPIILIGGTNGKGSTCAYLTTCLTLAGYKVGTFTSPHVLEYNERICINNKAINDNNLLQILSYIINHCGNKLGLFKTFTLAAHYWFMQQNIDIAVIEVGIGGRNDITNLFTPSISAITSIALDHCEILGYDLETIGLEKAGIFRPHIPCFYGDTNPPYTVIDYAQQINAELNILGRDFNYTKSEISFDVLINSQNYFTLPLPSLRGNEQLKNATLAIAILDTIKQQFPIGLGTIKTALLQTKLLGRFHLLPGVPQIIIDSAHNPQAVNQMLQNMVKLPFVKHNYAIFSCAADKDANEIIRLCADKFDKWFIAQIASERSIEIHKLRQILLENNINKSNIIICDDIKQALINAKQITSNEDRIIAFGSFLVIEQIYSNL